MKPASYCRDYIENLHLCTAIKRSAIVGYPSGDVWACSQGADKDFVGTADEIATFIKAFDDLDKVLTVGVKLEGTHFKVYRADKEYGFIFGEFGNIGIIAAVTTQALLIAVFEGGPDEWSAVREAVDKEADFLKLTEISLETARSALTKFDRQVLDIENWAQRISEATRRDFKKLIDDANTLAKDMEQQNEQLAHLANKDRNMRAPRDRLSDQFMQILNRLQAAQRRAERTLKDEMIRVRHSQEKEEERDLSKAEAASFDAQRQSQIKQQQQAHVREIKERTETLQELERDIADVQTIFTDLTRIVPDQGEMVESIEENVDQAQIRVEQGGIQLQQAVYYQSQARKKKCMLIIVLCIFLLIVALTVYFYIK